MTFEMADTGGLESDVKVGSEMRGDKIAVCAVHYSWSSGHVLCKDFRQKLYSSLFDVILANSVQLS